MVVSTRKIVYARDRDGQNRPAYQAQTRKTVRTGHRVVCGCLIAICLATGAIAENIRIATYNVSLGRDGPGLLARDIALGTDTQIALVAQVIATVDPDILLLNDFDYDYGGVALGLFADQLAALGVIYPYQFARRPNSGMQTGFDLDGDGRLGGPDDAQGYGDFSGSEGMAILSKLPLIKTNVRDFSALLWSDLPGATLPLKDGNPFPSVRAQQVQRLSYKGHWDVPVQLSGNRVLHLLASHAAPPYFDWKVRRNALRNADEMRFWQLYLDGNSMGDYPPRMAEPFVLLGDLNADPEDGAGDDMAIRALLRHPLINDVQPKSNGAAAAAHQQGGKNLSHKTPANLDTVDWDEGRTAGNMRVDYVLPSVDLTITGAGVFWPAPGEAGFDLVGSDGDRGSHHRLVWIDINP